MSVQLIRDSRVFISTVTTGFTKQNTIELLVQDDLDFGQDSNFSDVSLNEAGPVPQRGAKRFNDSLNPANWSFSTYILPYLDKTSKKMMVPDYLLWHALASSKTVDLTTKGGFYSNETNAILDFKDNQAHVLAKVQIFIQFGTVWYHIKDCQVNQAEINIDIENIATTAWSGNGIKVTKLDKAPFVPNTVYEVDDALFAQLQSSYLVNKLTVLKLKNNKGSKEYNIPITGGTLTVANNITYLTPSTSSRVDTPIGSFTGTFNLTGSVSAYLNDNPLGSAAIYKDLLEDLQTVNSYQFAMIIGGEYEVPVPVCILVANNAQVSVPSLEIDEVISTQIEFAAIPSDWDVSDQGYFGFSHDFDKAKVAKFIKDGDAHTL